MGNLRVSSALNLHSYPVTDIDAYVREGLAFHKRMGFDAADFSMNFLRHMGDNWEAGIETVLANMEQIGLPIELCHLPYGVSPQMTPEAKAEFDERMRRSIIAAKRLGVKHAVLHPTTTTLPRLSFSEKEQHEQVISSLAPYVEQGKKIGLDIVVENMRPVPQIFPYRRYCAEAEELCRVADDLELGICWDFGHANIAGLKQSEALACVGSRLRMLHVNDNFAWGDDHVPPFIGTINWADAMQGLRAVGFNGLLNYELTTGRVPANAREAYAKYILEAAARLNELFNA